MCILLLVMTGCTKQKQLRRSQMPFDLYPVVMTDFLPDYTPAMQQANAYDELTNGTVLESFDAQAIPAIQKGVGRFWYPQCLSTVVIAVDRDQTDEEIHGWKDLLSIGETVGMSSKTPALRLLLGAISYGLEGEDFSTEQAIGLLEALYRSERLCLDQYDEPVTICFDFQAAAMARKNKNIEIIVPSEGTLSFELGLLSEQPLQIKDGVEEALLAAGLRLRDGRSSSSVYPDEKEYERAVRLDSFDHLLDATKNATRELDRNVIHIRLYTAADQREKVFTALLIILLDICWMVSANGRTMRRDIQRVILTAGSMIACWVLLRLYQMQLPYQGIVSRLCWYGFFVFQIGLPLTMLWLALIIDHPENSGVARRPMKRIGVICLLTAILIWTNDLHQLVFRVNPNGNWEDQYSFGVMYYLMFVLSAVLTSTAMVMLMRKNWNSPRKLGWIISSAFCLAILLYAVGYAVNVPAARESDYAITNCVFSILFFESALRSGLVPANTRYRELFEASPLNMQLVDEVGRTVLASATSTPLPAPLWNRLRSQPGTPILRDENTMVYANEIHGGMVVWQEDIRALEQMKRERREAIKRLRTANAQLAEQNERKRRQFSAEVRTELISELEQDCREKTERLFELLHTMHEEEDGQLQAWRVALLLCHIKRRCNLFYHSQESNTISADELTMYVSELAEFAGYASIRALLTCTVHAELKIRHATLFYDFVYDILDWAVRTQCSTLLGQLEKQQDRFYCKMLPAEPCGSLIFSGSLQAAVAEEHGAITYKELDDTTAIWLSFPTGGETDD